MNKISQAENTTAPKLRLHLLDSLRGWASLQVLVFHVAHEMFARKAPLLASEGLTGFLINGGFAVAVFFILSGEVLSHGYFVTNDINLVRKLAIKRYVRLTIPIFASCFIVFVLMKSNLIFSHQAAILLERPDWLAPVLNFDATLHGFLNYALVGVYFHHSTQTSYNPFLWTMSVELFGSIFVFLTLFLSRTPRQRWAIYAIVTPFMLLLNAFYFCFVVGMIFGEMRVAGLFKRLAAHKSANRIALSVVAAVALVLSTYHTLHLPDVANAGRLSLAAALVLFAVYSSNRLQGAFDNRLSHFFGELSFPIYLIQFPVIVSLQSFLVVRFFPDGGVPPAGIVLIIAASLAASLLAAWLFVFVERFAIRSSNNFFALMDRL